MSMVNTFCVESETEPHLEMNLQYLDLKNGLVVTENLMMFSEQIGRVSHGRINHGAKRAMAQGPPPLRKIFVGYLIVIYIGKQITDIYATRYHAYVHGPWVIGYILLYVYKLP